jgi:ubiquitin C-terminal hydrolase
VAAEREAEQEQLRQLHAYMLSLSQSMGGPPPPAMLMPPSALVVTLVSHLANLYSICYIPCMFQCILSHTCNLSFVQNQLKASRIGGSPQDADLSANQHFSTPPQ